MKGDYDKLNMYTKNSIITTKIIVIADKQTKEIISYHKNSQLFHKKCIKWEKWKTGDGKNRNQMEIQPYQ